jgi:hypothetical protein
MIAVEGTEALARKRTLAHGEQLNDYFVPEQDGGLQAFRVNLEPSAVVRPHFHRVDQYQVFVDGSGAIGKHRIESVCVHYTDRYSSYGPIVAGPAGMSYYTLRRQRDPGAIFMPEGRAEKVMRSRRNISADVSTAPPQRPGASACTTLIERREDGLEACVYTLGSGAEVVTPDPAGGGGQYALILEGSLAGPDGPLGTWSCLSLGADEPSATLRAGPDGSRFLLLGYPSAA